MLLVRLTVGQIEQRSGVHRTAIRVLVGDVPGRPASRRVTRKTAAALLAVGPDRVGPERIGLVDAVGTRRRLRALVALGWSSRYLTGRLGVSARTTWELLEGTREAVTVRVRDAVGGLYDELSLSVPPGRTRARRRAAERRWAPPLAWDEETIDDPDAKPARAKDVDPDLVDWVRLDRVMAGERVKLSRAERRAVLGQLVARGLSDSAIGALVGSTWHTVQCDRRDLGLASARSVA